MSIEASCGKCGAEYDVRHGKCPACGATKDEQRRAAMKTVPKVPTKCPCCGFLLEVRYHAYETFGRHCVGSDRAVRGFVERKRKVYFCRFCKVTIKICVVSPLVEEKLKVSR